MTPGTFRFCMHMLASTADTCVASVSEVVWTNFPHFLSENGLGYTSDAPLVSGSHLFGVFFARGVQEILHALGGGVWTLFLRFPRPLAVTCSEPGSPEEYVFGFPAYGFRKMLRIPFAWFVTGYSSCVSHGGFSCSCCSHVESGYFTANNLALACSVSSPEEHTVLDFFWRRPPEIFPRRCMLGSTANTELWSSTLSRYGRYSHSVSLMHLSERDFVGVQKAVFKNLSNTPRLRSCRMFTTCWSDRFGDRALEGTTTRKTQPKS